MRIAIAVIGNNDNAQISSQAARAPFFMVFEDNKLIETIRNPFRLGSGGAGFSVAKLLEDKGVEKIVAERFGENMVGALEERGISFEETTGTLKEFLNKKAFT